MKLKTALLGCTIFFTSCETDFDVTAPWKDIPVVYGLLDSQKDTQYIKINKTYLNENKDARELATIPDSIYYGDELNARLVAYRSGFALDSVRLRRDTFYNKEKGTFAHPINILYKTSKSFPVSPENVYKLILRNEDNGNKFTAQTKIVGKTDPVYPEAGKVINFGNLKVSVFQWFTAPNAYFYNLKLVFHFREVKNNAPGDTVDRSIAWTLFELKKTNTNEIKTMQYTFRTEQFFRFLGNNLEKPVNSQYLINRNDSMEFIYSAGANEIYTYIRIHRPSSGIVQKKPEYTNIKGGKGIFSSRSVNRFKVGLSDTTVEAIISNKFTKPLNFVHY